MPRFFIPLAVVVSLCLGQAALNDSAPLVAGPVHMDHALALADAGRPSLPRINTGGITALNDREVATVSPPPEMAPIHVTGRVVPRVFEEISTPRCELRSSFTLDNVTRHGAVVNAGQQVASINERWADQALQQAHQDHDRIQMELKAARVQHDLALEKHQFELARAEQTLRACSEDVVEFQSSFVLLHTNLRAIAGARLRNVAADKAIELQHLCAMYSEDECIDDVEGVVIQRAKRDLELAERSVELHQDQTAHEQQFDHPRELLAREQALAQAKLQLSQLQCEEELGHAQRLLRIDRLECTLVAAADEVIRLETVCSGLLLIAPTSGVLLHGGRDQWTLPSGGVVYRTGDRVAQNKGVFVVAAPESLGVCVSLDQMQWMDLHGASIGIASLHGKPQRVECEVHMESIPNARGGFCAFLAPTSPWMGATPGMRAETWIEPQVFLGALWLPGQAVSVDQTGAWCMLRAVPGEPEVRVSVELGLSWCGGWIVRSGLELGAHVLTKSEGGGW